MIRIHAVAIFTCLCIKGARALECATGYGQNVRVIPDSWINDGFCDCPMDALDEPNTEACSGAPVGGWSGMKGRMESSPTFQCPQQKTKQLPLSRLNDGVCDCCDGADESGPLCEDICDTVLAAERAAKLKAEQNYEIGSVKRKEALAAFEALVKQTIVEIEEIEQDLKTKDAELELVNKELHDAKLAYADHRRAELLKVLSSVIDVNAADSSGVSGLLRPLTDEELKLFIQLTCQLSGEMEGSVKQKTCVPLRLAGVDLGILWRDEAFKNASVELISIDDDAGRRLHSELVHKNQQGEKMWSKEHVRKEAKPSGRRRLDEYMDDDDDFHDYHDGYESNDDYQAVHDDFESSDDFHADYDDNESNDDDEVYQEAHTTVGNPAEVVEGTRQTELDKVKAEVEGTVFSRGRMAFLSHADGLVAKIEEFIKSKDEAKRDEADDKTNENELDNLQSEGNGKEDENVEVEVDASGQTSRDTDEPLFDPMAYTMAKSTLKRRTQSIRRGLQYALSARILVGAVSSNDDASTIRSILLNLAGATLMHSRASAEHVWGILSTILPELERASEDDTHTCTSPLANLCPPRVFSRSGQDYPPLGIRMAGEAACTTASDEFNPSHCPTNSSEVLTNFPNGYYGYHEIRPRGEDDVLHLVFSPLQNIIATSVSDLEERQRVLEVDKASLEGKLTSLSDKIGGRDDHDTFKGELHALKDLCYTVAEGKYDYEVCIFGKAVQKDKGASSGSGTSLGNWKGMSIDDVSGDRVMKWINGQQCWNGPARSATVIVRCGAETKLQSAEEPDTCSYVLEMESHIACDDAYFKKYLA